MKPLLIIGSVITGALLLTKKAKAELPKDGEGGAAIKIQVYDSQGNLVPSNSPLTLNEGQVYTVKLTVKNNSTKGGVPCVATLATGIQVVAGAVTPLLGRLDADSFAAGETQNFLYDFTVPTIAAAGTFAGRIDAWVEAPIGKTIATAIQAFDIAQPIVYGATIVIG